jgi:thymidine phosphorylase
LADLGGTRLRIGESLDLSAGIQFLVVVGESITRGQPIATLHCRDSAKAAAAARRIEAAVTYSDEPVAAPPLILDQMGPGV